MNTGKIQTWLSKHGVQLILAVFFVVFALISWWSPAAGDDWAYAVNSVGHHPLILALERYFTWSGRFFSELWGYIIPNNKWLWDWLNPLIFTGILYWMIKDSGAKKHPISSSLLLCVLIFTVTDYLRMQTYSWMMGTTYVVPFLLFLVYIFLLEKWIFEDQYNKKIWIGMCVLNFVIPLWMENMAAVMAGGDLLILIYLWFKGRTKFKKMVILSVIACISTAIIALSPGAASRSQLDHAEFMALSLVGKVKVNLVHFVRLTFTDNVWVMRILSVLLILVTVLKRKNYPYAKWHCFVLPLCFVWGILQSYAWYIYEWTGSQFFYDICDPTWSGFAKINLIFYGIYVLAALYVIFTMLKGNRKWLAAFVFFCAGGANLVMLISPIFDSRSSFYTVYLFFFLCILLYEELEVPKAVLSVLTAVLAVCWCFRLYSYLNLYYQVSLVTEERQKYISWYLGDRTIKEGDMPAYSKLSIHSGNIDEGDDYHLYYFLRYYDLDPDLKLTFIEYDVTAEGNQQ